MVATPFVAAPMALRRRPSPAPAAAEALAPKPSSM
eukprot:CAMPEP_0182574310 /NCGR_PEP_ID=MMETSP1324-20130603/24549_1 /TAXON_ID=236786 /ORGANISM="Florenciella sp., Strain RCC1587" /LENGTH=34 /DNA_ID= /DNA_START= /DNA_END= /DNA_ORIENTATION=